MIYDVGDWVWFTVVGGLNKFIYFGKITKIDLHEGQLYSATITYYLNNNPNDRRNTYVDASSLVGIIE